MRIGIAARWLTCHDAVSNDVFGMYEALKQLGYDVYIFNELRHWRTYLKLIRDISKAKRILSAADDILIYHYTSGWDAGLELLKELKCKKIIRYHGITPAHFFKGISSSHEKRAHDGLEMAKQICNLNNQQYWTNSKHSKNELETISNKSLEATIIPPFHIVDTLLSTKPHAGLVRKLGNKTNILTVGRISPNKGLLDLVQGFAEYYSVYNNNSRLIICGKENKNLSTYTNKLKHLINELNLDQEILIINKGSVKKLKALYYSANAYVSASEHEGFCVPIIEALAHNVPVIGRGNTALPETIGTSGSIWENEKPEGLATLINDAVKSKERSSRYYREMYSLECIKARLNEAIRGI